MNDVLALILGGGRGERLYPLTKQRSEPAVPLAGKYRLIDIPVSNCINSGVPRVFVLTQFLSVSLHRHIASTYKFDPFSRGFVEVLAAQQTNEAADWYRGTADAVRQNLTFVREEAPRDVLLLSGDQLYRMDFRALVETHRQSEADVTIAAIPVRRDDARRLGILRRAADGRVVAFAEKPQSDAELDALKTPGSNGRDWLANMGIYLFNRRSLDALLAAHPAAVDLVREIVPRCLASHRFQAHLFEGYWEDLGSIRSYHEAHLALAGDDPPFDFSNLEGVIYTHMRHLPASQVLSAQVEQALIADGCFVGAGSRLEQCVVGVRSRIGKNVVLKGCVVNGADRYETDADRAVNRTRGLPDIGIGDGSHIENAILDKDCRLGRDVRIVNAGRVRDGAGDNFVIRDGIVVIPDGAAVADGTVI